MNNQVKVIPPLAKAFISCSLREEDREFNDQVESLLKQHNIEPFGTVGKYSVSPESIAESMKKNIPLADLVVIIATPRYLQKDLKSDVISQGLSEMVHVETGIAYALNKPVVVFVQKDTNIGNFLPGITQYIELDKLESELDKKLYLIQDLLNNALAIIKKMKASQETSAWKNLLLWVFAIIGGLKVLKEFFRK